MRIRTHLALVAIVLAMTPILGAEPPGSPEARTEQATHVFVGEVKAVYARAKVTDRQGPGTVETHYLVEIEVDVVEKGEGLAKKTLAYVRCWEVTKHSAEPLGHDPVPEAGNRVRAYVAKGPYDPTDQVDDGMTAVYPDGFEVLAEAAPSSKATPPVVVYEWPPYVDDLRPEEPGSTPGLDIHAKNPYVAAGDTGDMRYVRVHVTPGRNPDGSTRRVLGVHFRGPPGLPLAAHAAYVAQSHAGWTSTRLDDTGGYSFASTEAKIPMPETGFVFVFVVRREVLEKAYWRDAQILLADDGQTSLPDDLARASSLVGSLHTARRSVREGTAEIAFRLPYAER